MSPRHAGADRKGRTVRALLAGAAAAASLLGLLLVEAHRWPELTADEVWAGLAALEIQEEGLTTPHGMNEYTAPVLPWLIAKTFDVASPDIGVMRAMTSVLAAAGLFFVVFGIVRVTDLAAGMLFLALFMSCLLWTWYGRVAFEVIGLQDLLLGVSIATTLGIASSGRYSLPAVTALLYATAIGTVSHLLFVVVPAGFASAALMLAIARDDETSRKLLVLALISLAMVGGVVLAKLGIDPDQFQLYRTPILALLLVVPPAVALFYRFAAARLERGLAGPISRLSRSTAAIVSVWVIVGSGLVYALAHHGVALVQVYSSIPLMQRLASFTPPMAVQVPMYAWAGVLSIATIGVVISVGTPAKVRAAAPLPAFLGLWFVTVLVWLAVATTGNSIRYYRIPVLFAFLAISVNYALCTERSPLRAAAVAMIPAVALNLFAVREARSGTDRVPIDFTVGSMVETSAHFIDLDDFVAAMRLERACEFRTHYFIDQPMRFFFALDPWECDPDRVVSVDYCYDCDDPPFVRWSSTSN